MRYLTAFAAVIRLAVITACISLSFAAAAAQVPVPRLKPEAPGPIYLSRADYTVLNNFFDALDAKKWSDAALLRQQVSDPIGRSVADWAFIKTDADLVTVAEIGNFLDANPDWPLPETFQRYAEDKMSDTESAAAILKFYQKRLPISGNGKLQLARALYETGKPEEAKRHLRSAWINHIWPASKETKILRDYGQYLTAEDHILKVDKQLFKIEATNSKRLLPLLPSRERAKAEARIALLRMDGNARRLLEGLSADEQKDAGVLHAATRYYRRRGDEPTAIIYALRAPLNEQFNRNPSAWWYEKRLLARWAIKNSRYEDAYGLTAFTGLSEGEEFADAEFMAGWVALRFLNDPKRAEPHFAYLNANVSSPISVARAQYWLGRTAEAANSSEDATIHYTKAAEQAFTYYGQLAAEKLGNSDTKFPPKVIATAEEENLFNSRPTVHAMRIFAELDRELDFITFARRVDDDLSTQGEVLTYERLMEEEGKIFLSVRAAKAAVYNGAIVPQVSWPNYPVPAEATRFTEQALILGLTRQESEFNSRAYSSARARGLMQLLPSTAQITARKEGIPYSQSRLLDDPSYNMTLGAAHLNHLISRFEGSYILTLVAYNAGPNRAEQWILDYGDPRQPNVDPIDWVELIPFTETRNYVQRVLENVQVYRARIEPNRPVAGNLGKDLTRGGSTLYALERSPSSPKLEAMRVASPSVFSIETNQLLPSAMTFQPLFDISDHEEMLEEEPPFAECDEGNAVADADDLNTRELLDYLTPPEC